MERSQRKKRLLAGGGCLALTFFCCCPCTGAFWFAGWPSMSVRSTAVDFVDAARNGENQDAYALMSNAYRSSHDRVRFDTGLRHCSPLVHAEEITLDSWGVNVALDHTNVYIDTGASRPRYRLALIDGDDGWRVDALRAAGGGSIGCRIDSAHR